MRLMFSISALIVAFIGAHEVFTGDITNGLVICNTGATLICAAELWRARHDD